MAGTFGCDPQAAGRMSEELARIRSSLTSMGRIFESYAGATASDRIEHALQEFYSHSSDNRENMDALLERASGLLRGLAEGTNSVDQGLAGSLEPANGSPPAAVVPVGGSGR